MRTYADCRTTAHKTKARCLRSEVEGEALECVPTSAFVAFMPCHFGARILLTSAATIRRFHKSTLNDHWPKRMVRPILAADMNRGVIASGIAGLLLCVFVHPTPGSPARAVENRALADSLFTNGEVLRLSIDIPEAGRASLRREPRRYVKAAVREGDTVYTNVGLHLKGSIGSFRSVDEKAGLTLNFDFFGSESGRFHGLKKFHLNNSVQDPSYLSELIASQMFRQAGVPAPRATHALVQLNGRKPEFYVLLESVDRDFLARDFKQTRGNVYGQPGGCEVTDQIKRMEGQGPLDYADLKALAAALQEPDSDLRFERVRQRLDVDRFLSFMALEVMLGHWDGYTFARHNYVLYHDLDTDRMVFIPHDLDQLMRDINQPIMSGANGMVAQAILKMPETRARYRERCHVLFTNVFRVPVLTNQIQQTVARLQPALKTTMPRLAMDLPINAGWLIDRFIGRGRALEQQMARPVTTLPFESDAAHISGWHLENSRGGASLDQLKDTEGRQTLHIRADGLTRASWRARVVLESGRYRFEGLVRTAGLEPTHDVKGEGAGLRVSSAQDPRANGLKGNAPWQRLVYEFTAVMPNERLDLICELRGTKGEAWFDADSLRLVRLR
jgi:spore coat protein H